MFDRSVVAPARPASFTPASSECDPAPGLPSSTCVTTYEASAAWSYRFEDGGSAYQLDIAAGESWTISNGIDIAFAIANSIQVEPLH